MEHQFPNGTCSHSRLLMEWVLAAQNKRAGFIESSPLSETRLRRQYQRSGVSESRRLRRTRTGTGFSSGWRKTRSQT